MTTVDAGNRHWPPHGTQLAPSSQFPSASARESHGPKDPRNNLWSENAPKDSLPSATVLDLETAAKDNRPHDQSSPAMATSTGVSASTPSSYHHPSDSHPYKPSVPNSGPLSPSHPRHDEKEKPPHPIQPSIAPQPRQSLPSIHEALGNNNPLPYPPASQQASHHPSTTTATISPVTGPHPGSDGPSGPPNPFSSAPPSSTTPSATPAYLREPRAGHTQDAQRQRLSLVSINSQDSVGRSVPSLGSSKSPSHSTRTGNSSISSSGQPSASFETSGQPAAYANSMSSPTGYGPYPQPMAYSGQIHGAPSGMTYSAPFEPRPTGGPWGANSAEIAQTEEAQRAAAARGGAPGGPYSESVKRHLEGYDVEASLNEIAEASGRSLDFSRVYSARAHQSNRTGPLVGSLPSLSEIDTLLQLHRRSSDALTRIRNTVLSQEHALAERRTQRRAFKDGAYGSEHPAMYQEDTKGAGGFASGDVKKRRGKAAPPGRCHSCNRAETPEWRRGPDGARTLCNACGLHYAKLTRKMGANKASALGSNFRPRSSVEMRS